MSKVAFTTLLNRGDSVLSPHFGMAKWVMIRDDDTGAVTFEQNTGLTGRAVVDIIANHGCTDAVFAEIGPGAIGRLQAAGIRGWLALPDIPVPQLIERLSRGELAAVSGATQWVGGARPGQRRGASGGLSQSGGAGGGRGAGCTGGQRRHRRPFGSRT